MFALACRRALTRCALASRQSYLVLEFSTAAPFTSATSVPGLLAAARAASPMKDAIKFYGVSTSAAAVLAASDPLAPASDSIALWSYRDVDTHVRALATGMSEAGFHSGDKIVSLMPCGTPEYVSLVLAAADLGMTVVALELPVNPKAVDVASIRAAVDAHKAKALFIWHGFKTEGAEDGLFGTGENSIVSALAPSAAADDARGRSGFLRVTGRPLAIPDMPSLGYIVHTGDAHIRGAIAFKSLLCYSDAPRKSSGSSDNVVLVEAPSGKQVTHSELLHGAKEIGARLQLSSDPYAKNGKLVVRSDPTSAVATALVSALMHETLMISPGLFNEADKTATAAAAEEALLL
jgi:acyl-CoA synthetase (AMP-forming)/AMP-acid ligase II